jgi:hypothetical protein
MKTLHVWYDRQAHTCEGRKDSRTCDFLKGFSARALGCETWEVQQVRTADVSKCTGGSCSRSTGRGIFGVFSEFILLIFLLLEDKVVLRFW